MITIIKGMYIIGHFPCQRTRGFVCCFRTDFFSEKTIRQVSRLPIFRHHQQTVYPLTPVQEKEVTRIFKKLLDEKDSDYIFSEDLQRTYIIELLHCITKIHQKTVTACLN